MPVHDPIVAGLLQASPWPAVGQQWSQVGRGDHVGPALWELAKAQEIITPTAGHREAGSCSRRRQGTICKDEIEVSQVGGGANGGWTLE